MFALLTFGDILQGVVISPFRGRGRPRDAAGVNIRGAESPRYMV
jgi:hypothetical protein